MPREDLERRVATLGANRAVKLVFCGRLHPCKGLDRSLNIIAAARAAGAGVEFDIIGDGQERENLAKQGASELGIGEAVRFHGALPYGPDLLRRLAQYDGLLFTPISEDSARMIFDGYAAGLPLVAFDINYVRERAAQEKAACLLPRHNLVQAVDRIVALCGNRDELANLARAARNAADYHAAENWYRRRAEWTIEAVDRHHAEG